MSSGGDRITTQSTGPGLALLAPAGDRDVRLQSDHMQGEALDRCVSRVRIPLDDDG